MKKIVVRSGYLTEEQPLTVVGTHYEVTASGHLHILSGSELVASFMPGRWNSVYYHASVV